MEKQEQTLDVLIVGAGFTGLYMLHKMRECGFSSKVIEAASGVGGTWFWNRYPGARCDIPSIEYSYSFSPELEREWRWSERYAAQPEILRYLEHVAERFDLMRDITLNTRVTGARWNESTNNWTVETDQGETITAQFVVLGTGALSKPKLPDLPGLENFKGDILHTALWNSSIETAGKKIAVFGTGSSGIQAIPQLERVASELTVFQRTPNYAVPSNNRDLSDEEYATLLATLPEDREKARHSPLGFFSPARPGKAIEVKDEDRTRRFDEQWAAGTTGMLLAYEDLLFNEDSNQLAAQYVRDRIAETVKDPDKIRKMSPDYPLGSRRMCSEIDFYKTMGKDSVTLVDVREDPVVSFTAASVQTQNAEYPADVLVFATGFDACIGAIKAIDIRGRDDVSLREEWEVGLRAYLGLAVSGFPNLWVVTGPGSPSVMSNVVMSIEQHVEWISECMVAMREQGKEVIEALPDAEMAWMEESDRVANETLFPRADSWYKGRTRDGREVFMPYVGGVGTYRDICDEIAADGYRGFALRQVAQEAELER